MGHLKESARACRLAFMAIATVTAMGPVASRCMEIEMVTVGDPRNPADTSGLASYSAERSLYVYRIGKYEITNAEYCEFLDGGGCRGKTTPERPLQQQK